MKFKLLLVLLSVAGKTWSDETFVEIDAGQMDTSALKPRAEQVLHAPQWKWHHAQTDHFVLHFENGIFAAKVARMAEFFYTYIATELKGSDRIRGRSHIFIFRSKKDWEVFQSQYAGSGTEWAFSLVEGPAMYLQQAGDLGASAAVLGHEMTHMVINRFLNQRLPIWLNEGLAEWYGEFVYAEFKGFKKSKRAQYRNLKNVYPMNDLLAAQSYPGSAEQITSFYQTAKYLVGFLQLTKSPEAFSVFFDDIASGTDSFTAFKRNFEYYEISSLESDFVRFVK